MIAKVVTHVSGVPSVVPAPACMVSIPEVSHATDVAGFVYEMNLLVNAVVALVFVRTVVASPASYEVEDEVAVPPADKCI